MDFHISHGSKQPNRRVTHNLTINLPNGLLHLTHWDLFQILTIERINAICDKVMNGFQFMALAKIPYLEEFPEEVNLQYGNLFLEGHKLQLCLIMEKKGHQIEIINSFAYQPEVLTRDQLINFLENYLAAAKLTIHDQ